MLIARAWGVALFETDGQSLAATIFTSIFGIADMLLVAYAIWEALDIFYWRQRAFEEAATPDEEGDEPGGGEGGGEGGGQAVPGLAPLPH